MTAADDGKGPRLSRFEVLGAWLGVWTPPRDARVPPVPWRAIGVGAGAGLVVMGAALATVAPRIDDAKDARAAREQRALDERAALRRRILRAEQAPRRGRAQGRSRGAVMRAVQVAVARDGRRRFGARAPQAVCAPVPGADANARRVAFDCFVSVREIVGAGRRGALAVPFRSVVDFARGSFAFCKVNPPPGELIVPDPRRVVEIPRACRTPAPPRAAS